MAIDDPDNWGYYSELNIDNPCPDYQMRLVLKRGTGTNDPTKGIIYDGGNCSYDDMRDVRVGTDSDPAAAEQLPQWAESVDPGIERIIWVKTNGNQTLYLFIGNSNASEYSDGANTWIFLDTFETDTTGNYTIYTNTDNKSHFATNSNWTPKNDLRIITKTRFSGFMSGIWGSSISFIMSDEMYSSSRQNYAQWALSDDKDDGASHNPYILVLKANTKKSGSGISKKANIDFSLSTDYYFEYLYTPFCVKSIMRDGNYGVMDSVSNSSNIPDVSVLNSVFIELWHCNEWGSSWGFSWVEEERALKLHVKRDNTYSYMTTHNDFIAIGTTAISEPTWDSFGEWQEISPPPPPPPPSGGLSDIDITPARVITTDFPAAAGLPKNQKIRVYAKAVSGQEKEIILDALT